MAAGSSVRAAHTGLSSDLIHHTDFAPSSRCAPCIVSGDGRNSALVLTTRFHSVRSLENHVDFQAQTLFHDLAQSLRRQVHLPASVPWCHRRRMAPRGIRPPTQRADLSVPRPPSGISGSASAVPRPPFRFRKMSPFVPRPPLRSAGIDGNGHFAGIPRLVVPGSRRLLSSRSFSPFLSNPFFSTRPFLFSPFFSNAFFLSRPLFFACTSRDFPQSKASRPDFSNQLDCRL